MSLHDPAKSRGALPWVFGFSDTYMAEHNDPARNPDKIVARWGPFGGYPAGSVQAVRVLIPSGELWTAEDALAPAPDVQWIREAPAGSASAFTISFAAPGHDPPPSAARVLWRQRLANGHAAVLTHSEIPMGQDLAAVLGAKRTHLRAEWLRDVAADRIDLGAPGRHGGVGMHALPPEGHRLTILEWNAVGYWLADSSSS